jgi:hypothetical protein
VFYFILFFKTTPELIVIQVLKQHGSQGKLDWGKKCILIRTGAGEVLELLSSRLVSTELGNAVRARRMLRQFHKRA